MFKQELDDNNNVIYTKEFSPFYIHYTNFVYDGKTLKKEVIIQINKINKKASFLVIDYTYTKQNNILTKEVLVNEENEITINEYTCVS